MTEFWSEERARLSHISKSLIRYFKAMTRNPTLKDVAKLSGVSTATVARVLHDNGYVATETRERVESALNETGYQLNVVAQGLRKQRSFTIGHSLHTMTQNPFFARVALGVEERALHEGYGVFIFNTQGDAERERLGVETFIRRRVDAVIFTTAKSGENVSARYRRWYPGRAGRAAYAGSDERRPY